MRQSSLGAVGVLTVVVGATVAAGCGQKGPLYLPEHNGTVITRPGANRPAEPATTAPASSPGTSGSPQPQATTAPAPTPQGTAPETVPAQTGPNKGPKNKDSTAAPQR